jgi:hypothetical protein
MKQGYFNNKGQGLIASLFTFMIVAFIIVLVSVMFVYMGNRVQTELKEVDIDTAGNWTKIVDDSIGGVNNAYATLNWLTTFLILGYMLAFLMGCVFAHEHPVVFIIYIFITIIAIIVSVPLANAYYNLYLNSTLNPTFLTFESSSYILFKLPYFITGMALLGFTIVAIRLIRRS